MSYLSAGPWARAVLLDDLTPVSKFKGLSQPDYLGLFDRWRMRGPPPSSINTRSRYLSFFLGALAVWPRTAFGAAEGASAFANRMATALVRRTPG